MGMAREGTLQSLKYLNVIQQSNEILNVQEDLFLLRIHVCW